VRGQLDVSVLAAPGITGSGSHRWTPGTSGLTFTRGWLTVVQCGKTDEGISGLSRQALAWVVAQGGGSVAVAAARSLHGGESP
jgi:hypothetical protein